MQSDLVQRLRGCAVGAAVGDALGMPLEFGPRQPTDQLIRSMIPGRLPAGSFTDDTEMALALAESLLVKSPLEPEDLAQRFIAWMQTNPPDVGIQTASILSWMKNGLDWRAASLKALQEMPNSAGNGSVMRCWPVAVACWNRPAQLISNSEIQSRITHPHPDCVAGSVLVNMMIAALIRGSEPHTALKEGLLAASPSPEFELMILTAPHRKRHELKNSGWVRHTIESAVWGLLTTSSFEEAVIRVANLGADADTAAAVTGALAGAAYGYESIPSNWRDTLRGEWPVKSGRYWTVNDLIDMADRLSQIG